VCHDEMERGEKNDGIPINQGHLVPRVGGGRYEKKKRQKRGKSIKELGEGRFKNWEGKEIGRSFSSSALREAKRGKD